MTVPQASDTAGAARIDALAARIVARAAPLRFEVVESPGDLQRIYRLRTEIVIEKGWARADEIGPGGDCDRYDAGAVHIAGWDGTRLVACSRLVLPSIDRPLPTEEAFAIGVESAQAADVGRVAVAPGYRGAAHRALWALLSKSWLEMRARGFTIALTILTGSVARMYRSWGLEIVTLAPPREYWGEQRYPALVQPAGSPHEKLLKTVQEADQALLDASGAARETADKP